MDHREVEAEMEKRGIPFISIPPTESDEALNMAKIATQQDLNMMVCSTPGCDHKDHGQMYLHGRCHPESPTWTYYDSNDCCLVVICAECRTVIVRAKVAER